MVKKLVTAFLIILFTQTGMHSAFPEWETDRTPVFPSAAEETRYNKKMHNSEFKFVNYVSNSSPKEIKDYYRHSLLALGWEEKNLFAGLLSESDLKSDRSLAILQESEIVFQKGQDTIAILLMPRVSAGAQTRFSVGRGKRSPIKKFPSPESIQEELGIGFQQDIAPLYPGASLINSEGNKDSFKASYVCEADAAEVYQFYNEKMDQYGWGNVREQPLHKIEFNEFMNNISSTSECPECQVKGAAGSSVEAKSGKLEFNDRRSNACTVTVSTIITKEEGKEMPLTVIIIALNHE